MLKPGFSLLTALNIPPRHILMRLALISACLIATVTWYTGYKPTLALVSAAVGLFLAIRGWKHLRQAAPLPDETGAVRALGYDLALLICGGLVIFSMLQYLVFFASLTDTRSPDLLRPVYGLLALLAAVPFGIAIRHLKP